MSDLAGYLESAGFRPSTGTEYVGECPWCGKSDRMYVNAEDGETWDGKKKPAGRYICFSCNQKGLDFSWLLAELDGVNVREARATIAKWKLGGIRFKRAVEQLIPDTDEWLPAEFESVSEVWPKYLDKRLITRETAQRFNLGVCRRHDRCDQCKPRGGCPRNMAHRIILPIDCPAGKSYQGRAILPNMEPRYLSGGGSGQLLFGWSTVATSDLAMLVEGPFDALKVSQAGLPVVALMGKQLRDSQMAMLKERRRRYIVALDPLAKDKTAIDNACDIAERLDGLVVTSLPTDPGDATEKQILKAANEARPPREVRLMLQELRGGRRRNNSDFFPAYLCEESGEMK